MNLLKGRTIKKGKTLQNGLKKIFDAARGIVGATAGWSVAGASDTAIYVNCPASQTAATLLIPLEGLEVGDVITGFYLNGGIHGTAAVTVDAALHKAASGSGATPTDSTIGSMTQVSTTANTVLSSSNAVKSGLAETVADGSVYYLLVTVTTAAATNVHLESVALTYNKAS